MPAKTLCPVCGPGVPIDEDCCCRQCGATATGKGADEVLARVAEAERLLREAQQYVVSSEFASIGEAREIDAFLSASPPAAPPEDEPTCPACEGEAEVFTGQTDSGDCYRPCPACGGSGKPATWQEVGALRDKYEEVAADLEVARLEVAAWKERYGAGGHPFDAPAAPPPSGPLVQAVLDASERWAERVFRNLQVSPGEDPEVLAGRILVDEEREIVLAVAALRARKGEQGG